MNGNFEIFPTENDLVKKVVLPEHNFQMLVYYVGEVPANIPDDFVFAFGYLDLPRPSGGHGVTVVFAFPDHADLAPDKSFRHDLVINAMHHYVTKEWNRIWFDKVTYTKGYITHIYDDATNERHKEYLRRAENEIALKFHEWQNKHFLN